MNIKKLVPWILYLFFFSVLNETVFNVAIPKIAEQFSLTPSGISWMITIFMIFFGIGAVIYGKLSDIFSLRRLILIAIVIYNLGSVMGFLFQNSYPLIVLARAIQGIGASAIPALIFVVVARYFPAAERGKIFGLITATVSVGIGIGPVIGGFVAANMHWSFLFLIPLLTLISVPFFVKILPKEDRKKGSLDILGAILVGLGVGAFVLFLTISAWYYAAAFLALLALFIFHIRHKKDPFIDPTIFKNKLFRNGVIVGFCLFSIVIGIIFVIPIMLHGVHDLKPSEIGLILFPGAISSVIFGPIGGNLADKKGNVFVVIIGLASLVASLILISLFIGISTWFITGALLLLYIGFSMFQTALINSVSQTLPVEETGIGMGIFNLINVMSGAVGTALVAKLLEGKWLDFRFLSLSTDPKAFVYSNLMLLFTIVIILGGLFYVRSYRNLPKQ